MLFAFVLFTLVSTATNFWLADWSGDADAEKEGKGNETLPTAVRVVVYVALGLSQGSSILIYLLIKNFLRAF